VRRSLPLLLALVLGVAAALLVGCGGDRSNLVPEDAASDIQSRLAAAKTAIAAGECETAGTNVDDAYRRTLQLSRDGVDRRLRERLNDGFRQLRDVYAEACAAAQTTETTTTAPTETTETTATVPPETTTTETTPESTGTPSDATPPASTDPGTDPSSTGGVTPEAPVP
jgi:cell division septation protein DedD